MRILIFASGDVSNGIYSPVNGEGRWTWNLASLLAERNPDWIIDVAGGDRRKPRWGVCPPVSNINLISVVEATFINYDVVLYTPWEVQIPMAYGGRWIRCNDLVEVVKAKLYIHNTFSWTTGIMEFPCHQKGHILVYPFEESLNSFPKGHEASANKFQYEFLPYPHGWNEQAPGVKRKHIAWASKGVFTKEYATRDTFIPDTGVAALKALIEICQKYKDIEHIHFFTGAYDFNPQLTPLFNKLGLADLLKQLPGYTLHPWLTYDRVGEVLGASKIAMSVSGLSSSLTESICRGTMPLLTYGLPCYKVAEKNNVMLSKAASKEDYFRVMDLYMSNDEIYNQHMLEYQDAMKAHRRDNVDACFKKILEKYL
jgi:hypothetical protein